MKRRSFFGTLAAGGIGTVLAQDSSDLGLATDSTLLLSPLVLMAPRVDGIEAVWAIKRHGLGRVEWEAEDGSKGEAGADAYGFVPQGELLRVRLTGLKPGTSYRVRSRTVEAENRQDPVFSDWKTFRTLNPSSSSTRFVMWNDTHVHDETIRKLHEVTPDADFFVWNGDTCNDWVRDGMFVSTLLNPGECDITQGRPMFITYGNHDVRGAHAFKMPDVVATPDGRPFYAFRSGPVAVICLHTGEDKPDDHPSFQGRVAFDALRAEQSEWLKETIRRPELRDAPYRLVFCHIPLRWRDESFQDYSKTGFDRHSGRSRAAWHDALVEWKAQVILSGHTHQTAWLPPTAEFPYGQLTGGGPQMNRATWIEGIADADALRFKVTNMDNQVLHEVTLKPLV
jgi:hypothetical protein